MLQDYAFCGDVLAILESFLDRVAVVSVSFSMYLSHADGVPITEPFTIVIFVPSNTFMALSRRFPLTMS